jgi:hypothetical protein
MGVGGGLRRGRLPAFSFHYPDSATWLHLDSVFSAEGLCTQANVTLLVYML